SRVLLDAVQPRAARRAAHAADGAPHGAVALEPGAEGELPHAVAAADAALGLQVRQLVPDAAARRVAEAVERGARRLQVAVAEAQVALQVLQHVAARRVHAEVLERALEVRDVGSGGGGVAEEHAGEEEDLLRERKHERAQGGDVGLERVAADLHEVAADGQALDPLLVLLLVHRPEAAVVGALVGAHDVLELVLGAVEVPAAVGEQHGGAAGAEEGVGDEHGAALPGVPGEGDGLRADDDGEPRAAGLEHVAGEVHRDDAGAAPHAAEVVAEDVPAHLVVVDDHGGQRRRRVEEAAVDDEHADVLGADAALVEQLVQRGEHGGGRLGAAFLHGGAVGARLEHAARHVGLVADARLGQQPRLERQAILVELARLPRQIDELRLRHLQAIFVGWFVAGEVDEVDGPRPGHDVDGDGEGEDGEEGEDGGEVVGGLAPDLAPQLVSAEAADLGAADEHDDRDGGQVHAVADEVVVPEPHVLEVHRLEEVRQPPP
ncbi:Os03g0181550, partial [Oryza sativa Japonica Group]